MAKREKLFSVTIKDCEIQTFTVGGPGGGGKDTSNTGVRITHRPSGAVGEGREERSQAQNKQAAFGRMARSPKFQTWAKLVASELLTGESVEQATERLMADKYIKTEIKVDGKWTVGEVKDGD